MGCRADFPGVPHTLNPCNQSDYLKTETAVFRRCGLHAAILRLWSEKESELLAQGAPVSTNLEIIDSQIIMILHFWQ